LHKSQTDCNKLHKSSDETDRVRSRSLPQMRDSDSGQKPRFWETPTPHPCLTVDHYSCHQP